LILEGKVHKFGANIDTDVIIPGKYLVTTDPARLAPHCMEGIDPEFSKKVQKGDMIFAEENFGCGSSREHAPIAVKAAGVSCVVAKSFARIFYRNSINIGLPIMVCPEAVDHAKNGAAVKVDTNSGIVNVDGKSFKAEPFPEFIASIIQKGGLMEYVKERLKQKNQSHP
jgi:3-isopropylmalate/(R)-2-methylmalate dehydratase small subunit